MDAVWSKAAARTLFAPVRPVYLLWGEDDRQKAEVVAALRAAVVDEAFADFDSETLDADVVTVEQALAATHLAPFASPRRLVVLRRAELYRKRERQADAERLAAGIARLGEGSCLVLLAAAAEDEKARGKTILTAKLDAAIRAKGVAVQCRGLDAEDMQDWLQAEAAALGKRLEPRAAERLARAGRGERRAIANELEKALLYAGEAPVVTLAMVEATASYDPEDVMFRLVDAVTARDADRALCLLHETLRYDPKPQGVAGRLLALLARQFRLLVQAGELARRRIEPAALRGLPPDIAEELPSEGSIVSMAWRARDLYAAARSWSAPALARAFDLMLQTDLSNKGGGEGSEDVVTNLELLIVRLCTMR